MQLTLDAAAICSVLIRDTMNTTKLFSIWRGFDYIVANLGPLCGNRLPYHIETSLALL